jgi:hypothetical protein
MNKKDPISVYKAANGWIVKQPYDIRKDNVFIEHELHVFESFDALSVFIRKHFTDA